MPVIKPLPMRNGFNLHSKKMIVSGRLSSPSPILFGAYKTLQEAFMSRFILVVLITYTSSCAHMKKDAHQTEISLAPRQVFCSETNGDRLRLRLIIDLKATDLKEQTLHKQFEMPYFKRKDGGPPYFRISREILEWHNNRIVLAEVIPTETTDIFMLYVTSFEKSKRVKLMSNGYLLLRLCQDAEMSISGDKKLHSLKARLELIDENNEKNL